MKVLNANQVRQWDEFTIEHEPISPIDLMERASKACVDWITHQISAPSSFQVFCGKGNNGGDGLAIARMLAERGNHVSVYILEFGHLGTMDFQVNLEKLHLVLSVDIKYIQPNIPLPVIEPGSIIIDALFGTGLNRPLTGIIAELVDEINNSGNKIISIDLPSGMSADDTSKGSTVVNATHTLTFQCYKPALLMQENAEHIGTVHVIDINLHPDFQPGATWEMITDSLVRKIYKPRKRFSHKGNFGHLLLIAGSKGKAGAAILCAQAAVHAGAGLTTVLLPASLLPIVQVAIPEAMAITVESDDHFTKTDISLQPYNVIAAGPGLGTEKKTADGLIDILSRCKVPIVLDADALNIISINNYINKIPPGSIITPHPKEFTRLFGESAHDFERLHLAIRKSRELNIIIILKGHHTAVILPTGECFFNNTGNAGLAKGGSGDVLTGLIASLIGQGYPASDASLLAVYLHGLAADLAGKDLAIESITPSIVIARLGSAYMAISNEGESLAR